jgi:hypothetical protein
LLRGFISLVSAILSLHLRNGFNRSLHRTCRSSGFPGGTPGKGQGAMATSAAVLGDIRNIFYLII